MVSSGAGGRAAGVVVPPAIRGDGKPGVLGGSGTAVVGCVRGAEGGGGAGASAGRGAVCEATVGGEGGSGAGGGADFACLIPARAASRSASAERNAPSASATRACAAATAASASPRRSSAALTSFRAITPASSTRRRAATSSLSGATLCWAALRSLCAGPRSAFMLATRSSAAPRRSEAPAEAARRGSALGGETRGDGSAAGSGATRSGRERGILTIGSAGSGEGSSGLAWRGAVGVGKAGTTRRALDRGAGNPRGATMNGWLPIRAANSSARARSPSRSRSYTRSSGAPHGMMLSGRQTNSRIPGFSATTTWVRVDARRPATRSARSEVVQPKRKITGGVGSRRSDRLDSGVRGARDVRLLGCVAHARAGAASSRMRVHPFRIEVPGVSRNLLSITLFVGPGFTTCNGWARFRLADVFLGWCPHGVLW
jgi:hypothetical protein